MPIQRRRATEVKVGDVVLGRVKPGHEETVATVRKLKGPQYPALVAFSNGRHEYIKPDTMWNVSAPEAAP